MKLVATARNPIPSGAMPGRMVAFDGRIIRYCLWPHTGRRARGTVCFFTGWGEFIEKDLETVGEIRQRGYAVAMMDWRGQGGSDHLLPDPSKGHVEDFADYERDLAKFLTEIVREKCPAPFFGMAHSMGGHILLRSALVKAGWFQRIILSSPMVDIDRELSQAPFLRLLLEILVLIGFEDAFVPDGTSRPAGLDPFETNDVTGDRKRYERTRELLTVAPQLGLGSQTIGWARAASRSIVRINTPGYAESLTVPTVILAAEKDQIVSIRMTQNFAMRAKNTQYRVIPESQHEILQERDPIRAQFWAAFDAHIGA